MICVALLLGGLLMLRCLDFLFGTSWAIGSPSIKNDIFIWENKKFTKTPFLVKGDGPMNKQRKWF